MADDLPWKEHHELVVTPWPGLPEDRARYANAEVLWVNETSIESCGPLTCELRVFPFDQACDGSCPPPFDLCPATSPFYAQPQGGSQCSGILVGEDLILTAGHCLDPADCPQKRIIFDYSIEYPGDPLGEPVLDPDGETRTIPLLDIYSCVEARSVTPFPPDTDAEEAFSAEDRPAGLDYALMRLDRVVPQERIPFPIQRAAESAVGDPALILGHPHYIPMKAEQQALYSSPSSLAPFHVLSGNSGSGIVNLYTGKVVAVATGGGMNLAPSADLSCASPPRYDLCFICPDNTFGQETVALAAIVPPIGLQVAPAVEIHHYGPPTSPADFAWKTFSLSVPSPPPGEQPSREVEWAFVQEGVVAAVEVEPGGATAGHLAPGDPVASVRLRPAQAVLGGPRLVTGLTGFFDQTYGTRTPVRQQIHVGIDGFTASPSDAFDGEDDLGIHHGDSRRYRGANQWAVDQDLTVLATDTEDPNEPGASWPEWLELDGDTLPLALTLPCKGCGTPAEVLAAADGAGLDPGTYRGWIHFSSDDSGEPPFAMSREVYLDHCREVFVDPGLPISDITLQPGQDFVRTLNVSPTGGTSIADVDVITDLGGVLGTTEPPLQLWLAAPGGTTVFLKEDPDHPLRDVWDQDTFRDASGGLDTFDTLESDGNWVLTIHNDSASEAITFNFQRFHVRLHHSGAPPCV